MTESKGITHKPGTKSILDLRNLYDHNHLNLEPGFQRDSVWKLRDRAFLIDTILRNYPLPACLRRDRRQAAPRIHTHVYRRDARPVQYARPPAQGRV